MEIKIPKYTETGSWECTYSLERLVAEIERWKNGEDVDFKLQMNPDFQRGHVWTEKQQRLFIEALLSGGARNAKVIYLNNPIWLGCGSSNYKDFVCVDGLQRYTAIKNFVDGTLLPYGYNWQEYKDNFKFKMSHTFKININDLQTKKDVLKWYLEMNSNGTPHTEKEITKVKKMLDNENKKIGGENG